FGVRGGEQVRPRVPGVGARGQRQPRIQSLDEDVNLVRLGVRGQHGEPAFLIFRGPGFTEAPLPSAAPGFAPPAGRRASWRARDRRPAAAEADAWAGAAGEARR